MLGLREPTSGLSLTSKQGQTCRRGCDSERKRKEEGEEASVEGKGSSRASGLFQWMFAYQKCTWTVEAVRGWLPVTIADPKAPGANTRVTRISPPATPYSSSLDTWLMPSFFKLHFLSQFFPFLKFSAVVFKLSSRDSNVFSELSQRLEVKGTGKHGRRNSSQLPLEALPLLFASTRVAWLHTERGEFCIFQNSFQKDCSILTKEFSSSAPLREEAETLWPECWLASWLEKSSFCSAFRRRGKSSARQVAGGQPVLHDETPPCDFRPAER